MMSDVVMGVILSFKRRLIQNFFEFTEYWKLSTSPDELTAELLVSKRPLPFSRSAMIDCQSSSEYLIQFFLSIKC
jgi:hypothetical protein